MASRTRNLDESNPIDAILAQMRENLVDVIEDQDVSRHHWIKIKDQKVTDSIMRTYTDSIDRKILSKCLVPHTLADLMKALGMPHSTSYNKISSLIDDGFLVHYDVIRIGKAKPMNRYVLAIKKLKIEISEDGTAKVLALFPEWKHFDYIANRRK